MACKEITEKLEPGYWQWCTSGKQDNVDFQVFTARKVRQQSRLPRGFVQSLSILGCFSRPSCINPCATRSELRAGLALNQRPPDIPSHLSYTVILITSCSGHARCHGSPGYLMANKHLSHHLKQAATRLTPNHNRLMLRPPGSKFLYIHIYAHKNKETLSSDFCHLIFVYSVQ